MEHIAGYKKIRLSKPGPGEKYGDVEVDTEKSFAYYKEWNQWAKEKEVHPRNERRPLWMKRPLAPKKEHWYIASEEE